MACNTHTPSNDATPSPYHVLVLYLLDEDGILGGGFYIRPMGYFGGVCAPSFDELHAQCYEALAFGIKYTENAPFDITDPAKSVVFDFVECLTVDELDLAEEMKDAEDTFESIIEAIAQ